MMGKFLVFLFICTQLCAKVNIIEPWRIGLDTEFLEPKSFLRTINIKSAVNGKIIKGYFSIPFIIDFGIHKNIEASVNFEPAVIKKEKIYSGLTDIKTALKFKLSDEKEGLPRLISELMLTWPSGDYRYNFGTGGLGFGALCGMKKDLKDFLFYLAFMFQLNTKNPIDEKYGNVFSYLIGAQRQLRSEVILNLELKGFNHAPKLKNDKIEKDTERFELYLSIGLQYLVMKYVKTIETAILFGLSANSYSFAFLTNFSF